MTAAKQVVLTPLLVCLATMIGCAPHRTRVSGLDAVNVEVAEVVQTKISWLKIKQDGGVLHLSGSVFRRRSSSDPLLGHVDVSVLDAHGRVVEELSLPHFPENLPSRRRRSARFEAELPMTVPSGATIRIAHHITYDRGLSLECQDNQAAAYPVRKSERFSAPRR